VVVRSSGVLYGSTFSGSGNAGYGTVYTLTPAVDGSWTESILYRFSGAGDDTQSPQGSLAVSHNGVLYGTGVNGGLFGRGGIFSIAPDGTETVLYNFGSTSADAVGPQGVVLGKNGSLYGTTTSGGTNNAGTVFELTPPATAGSPWTESILHSFGGVK